ncbi:uncharacterized protein IL334_005475 [Kwoniella shivajii]|uniref:RecQ-mediated genome instability protein 1 n=1 Tax=Kwoniella shivajii TaxID=564305 RepID=A0ABZ1D389_9TREE|nr:hypothetical protein IL334_005475 [Kwoniella shivajii]
MMDIRPFIAFLRRTYPVPEVDPAWVQECVTALIDSGMEATVDQVHTQFLYSDLSSSTLQSRTFPQSNELHNLILFPRPTLLQLHSISEIGNSAFQIQTTMEQRSEVLSGQSRIRRMDEEEDDDNNPERDEGKVPPYPRGMLKLQVGDGRRIINAMEYKKINDLVLGQTSLGCKLLVQNVRCLRDTLLLTPENTQVIESSVEHLENLQKDQFLNDLKRRMGKLDEGSNVQAIRPPQRRIQPPSAVRPVPRAIAPPRNQSQSALNVPIPPPAAGPSRLRQFPLAPPQNAIPLFDPPPSPPKLIRPAPTRAKGVKASSTIKATSRKRSNSSPDIEEEFPGRTPNTRKPRAAAKAATARVQQLYHDIPEPDSDFNRVAREFEDDMDEFDYDIDVDESFIRQINEVEARASTSRQSTKVGTNNGYEDDDDDDSNDDDFMILDESMIRQIDHLTTTNYDKVKQIGHNSRNKNNSQRSGSSLRRKRSASSELEDSQKENKAPEIIEISD